MSRIAWAMPLAASEKPLPMVDIDRLSGGPAMPRSKSRAIDRSSARSGASRWAMPAGVTQASSRRSWSQAETRAPRLAPIASWTGASVLMATNTTAVAARGPASERPDWTAPTVAPVAMAKAAGSAPRAAIIAHHRMASPGVALGSTPRNRHSADARMRASICVHVIKLLVEAGGRSHRVHHGPPGGERLSGLGEPERDPAGELRVRDDVLQHLLDGEREGGQPAVAGKTQVCLVPAGAAHVPAGARVDQRQRR